MENFNHFKIKKIFIRIFGSSLILYLLVFAYFRFGLDQRKVLSQAVNYMQVPIDDLMEYSQGNQEIKEHQLRAYVAFYRAVIDYLPNYATAYGMLGYCYYQLGDVQKAEEFYKKAIMYEDRLLWFHYNLGAIYFNRKDFSRAESTFRKAFRSDINESLIIMAGSKIYDTGKPIYRFRVTLGDPKPFLHKLMAKNLKNAYRDTLRWITLCHFYNQEYVPMVQVSLDGIKASFDYDSWGYFYAGVGSYYLGRYDQAINYLRQSIEVDPDNGGAYFYLSKCYKQLNDEENKEQAARQAVILGWDIDKLQIRTQIPLKVL